MEELRTGGIPALGRLLMAFIFVTSGWGKLLAPEGTIAYLTHLGVPLPELIYPLVVALELGGGLCVLFGFGTRGVSAILAVYCVATAFLAHYVPGDVGMMIHFAKNICMAGGFLQLVAYDAGAWSVDALRGRRRVAALAAE